MTTDLQPGAALDVAVHAALGRTITLAQRFGGAPPYSTDANAALEAYEEMRKQGWQIWNCRDFSEPDDQSWRIELGRPGAEVRCDGPSFAAALCVAIVEACKR